MKIKIVTAAFLSLVLFSVPISGGPPNAHFDGVWVGTETIAPSSEARPDQQHLIPPPRQVIIVIEKGGQTLALGGGACPGRYNQTSLAGDTLSCGAGDCRLKFVLSGDGKTLTEHGSCRPATMWASWVGSGKSWVTGWTSMNITGTLHRESK